MGLVSLCALFIYGYALGKFSTSLELKVSLIFLGYYVLWALVQMTVTTFNALKKQAMAQVPNIVEHVVRSTLVIAGAYSGIQYGILYVSFAYLIGMGCFLGLTLGYLRQLPHEGFDRELFKSYKHFAAPMAAISLFTALSAYLDKVMIDFFWDSGEVGIFFGIQRIVQFIILSSTALGILLFPTISSFHSEGKIKEIRKVVSRAEHYLSFLIFPVTALLVVFSSPIARLLGEDYRDAGWVLCYLALFAFMSTLSRPFNQVITATGHLRAALFITIIALGTNIILNLAFIPDTDRVPDRIFGIELIHGAAGAAAATFIADCIRFVLVRLEAKRIVGYKPPYRFMAANLLAALLMAGGMFYLHVSVEALDPWYFLLLKLPLGILLYLILMILLGAFGREEFDFFMDIIHPGKMKRYISDELGGKED